MDDYEVEYMATPIDENTVLVTSDHDAAWIEERYDEILRSALENYPTAAHNSVLVSDTTSGQTLSLEYIDQLASGLNSSVANVITANAIILQKILSDAFFGQTYESVVKNINTDYKLSYGRYEEDNDYADVLPDVKAAIKYFNQSVGIKRLIRDAISGTYAEGNYVLYLRNEKNKRPTIDWYPLSIAYPSDYLYDHRNVIEFSIDNLKSRLRKTYQKTRKNKAVYYENIDKEVQANYPKEVVKAYRDGEKIVRLDPRYSDCVKFNSMGRKLGVSPLFRCLKPLIVLDQIQAADVSDSKARSKKIIFQKLRKELLGSDGTRKGFAEAAHAHEQAAQALKTNFGLYTAIPAVEDMYYVQAKAQSEDSINQQKEYTSKLLTALGIGFTDSGASLGAVKISVAQLLKTVNAIGESFEDVMYKFYRTYLEDCGFDPELAPTIKVIDSEQMEMDVRRLFAGFVYNTLNGSRRTAMNILDIDYDDERAKRQQENEDGDNDIFYARETSYTASGNSGGRPKGNDENGRQDYDESYREDT